MTDKVKDVVATDVLPARALGTHPVDAETRAWQDSHEPYFMLRVWRDVKVEGQTDNLVFVSVRWAAEVEALPALDKPHMRMAEVAVRAHEIITKILAALGYVMGLDVVVASGVGMPEKES